MSNAGSTQLDSPGAGGIYAPMAVESAADWYVGQARSEGFAPVSGGKITASVTTGKLDMSRALLSFGNVDAAAAAISAGGTLLSTLITNAAPTSGQAFWVAIEIDPSALTTIQCNAGAASASNLTQSPVKPTPTSGRIHLKWMFVPFGATAIDELTGTANGNAKLLEARPLSPTMPTHSRYPYVESGCTWTGDALGSTRAASMAAGVVNIAGVRLLVPAVVSRTFTASKDTYVDFADNGDGTASITYTEVTNNAASPALASSGTIFNTLRDAIIITGASNIASGLVNDFSVGAINQGSAYSVLPIASSIPYCVTDSLGNLIYNTNPDPKVIGYRQIVANFTTTATTLTTVTGLSAPIIIPSGPLRRVRVRVSFGYIGTSNTTLGTNVAGIISISGGQLKESGSTKPNTSATHVQSQEVVWEGLLSSGSKTVDARAIQSAAGTLTISAATTSPAFVSVEYV